jgi:hypothetical protein
MTRSTLTIAVLLATASTCPARPECGYIGKPTTIREDANQAAFIVHVRLQNPQGNELNGSTELVILSVVKDHPILKDVKVLRIPRYLPIKDAKKPPEFLMFADVFMGQPDFFRGIEGGPELARYVGGVWNAGRKGRDCVLAHCGSYLGNTNADVAVDVFRELSQAPAAEVARAARNFDPVLLRRLLRDDRTPRPYQSLLGLLLGLCGEADDAALLRECIARNEKAGSQAIEGFLTGIVLLAPKDGWPLLRARLADPSSDFPVRYCAVRAARTLLEQSPQTARKDVINAVAVLLRQNDIADIAIEDLRKWRAWEMTDRVLQVHDLQDAPPIVRRAVLRFALQSPRAGAKAYVERIRTANPEMVAEMAELLQLETPVPEGDGR